jgi:hypothetical protein
MRRDLRHTHPSLDNDLAPIRLRLQPLRALILGIALASSDWRYTGGSFGVNAGNDHCRREAAICAVPGATV